TQAVLGEFTDRLPMRVVHESKPGLSNARNCALRQCSADLLLWTDDDVLVDVGWLRAVVDAASQFSEAAAFGGSIEPWFLEEPYADLMTACPSLASGFCGLSHAIETGPIGPETPIWGANMAYRCKATEGLSFNVALGPAPGSPAGGDEVDFLRQVRARGGS